MNDSLDEQFKSSIIAGIGYAVGGVLFVWLVQIFQKGGIKLK